MIAKSTSETWYELANDACGEVDLLYRTEIHAVLNEISNICYLRYQHHVNRPTQACVGTTKRAQGWDQWFVGGLTLFRLTREGILIGHTQGLNGYSIVCTCSLGPQNCTTGSTIVLPVVQVSYRQKVMIGLCGNGHHWLLLQQGVSTFPRP